MVCKWTKVDHNHAYFLHIIILNSILLFYFTVCKSRNNKDIEINFYTKSAVTVFTFGSSETCLRRFREHIPYTLYLAALVDFISLIS